MRKPGLYLTGLLFLALLGGALSACTGLAGLIPDTAPPGGGRVANGLWGGEQATGGHMILTVTDQGATYELDCAHGTIDSPLLADATGHLDLPGTYVAEHGGPQQPDAPPDSHPARYLGTLTGTTLRLTIHLTDTPQDVVTFDLALGRQVRLLKCL